MTLTDQLRVAFKGLLESAGRVFVRLGIHPNMMTAAGVLFSAAGAYMVGRGNLLIGGLLILASGPFDALDGTIARLRGEPEEFGAFVDSVSDRYIELFIFTGLAWYFVEHSVPLGVLLSMAAAGGTVLVSYIRARAQGLGLEAKVGLFTRVERFLIVVPCVLFGIPLIGVGIIAVGANITALQRIAYVRRESRAGRAGGRSRTD
ncbi:MAG: CDP-alcohol phosphatidyltransferase family protein [Chloroflexi bacterium]|nr:CDP-alcohol phosphatidyltransferase family protein [Chloroflexota bacterium]